MNKRDLKVVKENSSQQKYSNMSQHKNENINIGNEQSEASQISSNI